MTTAIDQTGRAKALLKSAAKAADQLESDVRELVAMRAWEVLGYEDFSEMWEEENGFEPPTLVQVLAIDALKDEGMNTRRGHAMQQAGGPNGHTLAGIAEAVGVSTNNPTSTVHGILTQLRHGVPAEHVVKGSDRGQYERVIGEHGDRPYQPGYARPRSRRLGKASDELVNVGFNLIRSDADEIAKIAKQAAVPNADIYRQAVAEYLMRHRESRTEAAAS